MFTKLLGRIFRPARTAETPGFDLAKALEEAGHLIQTGDKHAAVVALRELLVEAPFCVPALNDLGACLADIGDEATTPLDDLAPQRLREAERCLADLLEQEVRSVATVDVAGGHLGVHDVALADGPRRAVVPETIDPGEFPGVGAVEHDDLASLLAVHPHVA